MAILKFLSLSEEILANALLGGLDLANIESSYTKLNDKIIIKTIRILLETNLLDKKTPKSNNVKIEINILSLPHALICGKI
jgi:hypothetical protein